MRSKNAPSEGQIDLFGARLADPLDSEHPLFVLAGRIDWQRFETKLGEHFADWAGRPALPTRLMVGLEYLKYALNEGDESVVDKFVENPYWQNLCGLEHFTSAPAIRPHSSSGETASACAAASWLLARAARRGPDA